MEVLSVVTLAFRASQEVLDVLSKLQENNKLLNTLKAVVLGLNGLLSKVQETPSNKEILLQLESCLVETGETARRIAKRESGGRYKKLKNVLNTKFVNVKLQTLLQRIQGLVTILIASSTIPQHNLPELPVWNEVTEQVRAADKRALRDAVLEIIEDSEGRKANQKIEEAILRVKLAMELDSDSQRDSQSWIKAVEDLTCTVFFEDTLAGDMLIPFESLVLGDVIGRGSFGTVFRADLGGAIVAAKCLRKEVQTVLSTDSIVEIDTELEHWKGLMHPNVVQLIGTCIDSEQYSAIFIMELCESTLDTLIHHQPHSELPLERVCKIGAGIAGGLAYLHSQHVIHRDLKPKNILLTKDLQPKLCDFGLSMAKTDSSNTLASSDICGTCIYMAPEQLVLPAQISTKSDVYALGITLWEMLHHVLPYETFPVAIVMNIIKSDQKLTFDPLVQTPDWLQDLISRCWATNRYERPDAKTVQDILEARTKELAARFVELKTPFHSVLRDNDDDNGDDNDDDDEIIELSLKDASSIEPSPNPVEKGTGERQGFSRKKYWMVISVFALALLSGVSAVLVIQSHDETRHVCSYGRSSVTGTEFCSIAESNEDWRCSKNSGCHLALVSDVNNAEVHFPLLETNRDGTLNVPEQFKDCEDALAKESSKPLLERLFSQSIGSSPACPPALNSCILTVGNRYVTSDSSQATIPLLSHLDELQRIKIVLNLIPVGTSGTVRIMSSDSPLRMLRAIDGSSLDWATGENRRALAAGSLFKLSHQAGRWALSVTDSIGSPSLLCLSGDKLSLSAGAIQSSCLFDIHWRSPKGRDFVMQSSTFVPTVPPISNTPTSTPTSKSPTNSPTTTPTTKSPTNSPTSTPTTKSPTNSPTPTPTTKSPTNSPTSTPTTKSPTNAPTKAPSLPPIYDGSSPRSVGSDGKCLSIKEVAKTNSRGPFDVVLANCDDTEKRQKFFFARGPNHIFTFQSGNYYCLDYDVSKIGQDQNIRINSCHDGTNQRWFHLPHTKQIRTSYRSTLCLSSSTSGIRVATCNSSDANQKFETKETFWPEQMRLNWYSIRSVKYPGACWDVDTSKSRPPYKLVLAICDEERKFQKFFFDAASEQISDQHHRFSHCVDYNGFLPDENVVVHGCHEGGNQKWYYLPFTKQVKTNHDASLCLSASEDGPMYMATCDASAINQKFDFHRNFWPETMLPHRIRSETKKCWAIAPGQARKDGTPRDNLVLNKCSYSTSLQEFYYDKSSGRIQTLWNTALYMTAMTESDSTFGGKKNVYLDGSQADDASQRWTFDHKTLQLRVSLPGEKLCLASNILSDHPDNLYVEPCDETKTGQRFEDIFTW